MFNLDDSHKPPTKEFIRKALTYGLLPEEQELADVNDDLVYLAKNRGRLMSGMIEFALNNKEKIRRIPVLGELALAIKRRMMSRSLSAQSAGVSELDLTGILRLGVDDFIQQLYMLALGRLPDIQEMENCKFALNHGAKKEAIIYMVCTSKEFAFGRKVAYLGEFRKANWNYRIREGIRQNPLLGWLWTFFAIPRRFTRLSDALLLQFSALQAQIDIANSENLDGLRNLSAQLKTLSIQNSDLQVQVESLYLENLKAFSMLEVADHKLKELETLIFNRLRQERLIVAGFPGGVTAVQTKDYIFGVPSEDWRLAVFLSLYGFFEPGTEKYFRSIVKEGMNVIDIGANLGIYTLHALTAGCNIYSYEPTPRIFKILTDNVGINGFDPTGRANLYNFAVSEKEDEVEFIVYEDTSGQSNSFFATSVDNKTIRVKTVCLDKHLRHLDQIDVVKIDVEGAEPLVLRGMKEIIEKNPGLKIIMEFAPSNLKRGGYEPLRFIEEIRAMGLGIQLISEETGEITQTLDEDLCEVFSANLLLEKPA